MNASAELYGTFQVNWRSEVTNLYQESSNADAMQLPALESDLAWTQKVAAARNAYYEELGKSTSSFNKSFLDTLESYNSSMLGAGYCEEFNTTVYVTVNIEVGDLVYSYDTVTEIVSLQEVTETFVRESDHINYLTVVDESGNEQVIETADSHPFWVVTDSPDLERAARNVVDENGVTLYHENLESGLNGFWVEAKDLREGDVFLGANGELSTLVTSERVVFPDGIKVYNFTVAGNHDYFVIAETGEFGQTCILVHNGKCDSALLADDMIKNGIKRPDNSAAHHIIPVREGKAQAARGILEKYEININSYVNGVFLSKTIHRGRHSGD